MPFNATAAGFSGVQSISGGIHVIFDNYAGAVMLFAQTNAPTGWVKDTTNDDAALRITTGSTSTGGSVGFNTMMTTSYLTPTGTLTGTSITIGTAALTSSQLPAHSHNAATYFSISVSANPGAGFLQTFSSPPGSWPNSTVVAPNPTYTAPTAGPWSHSHPSPGPGLLTFNGTPVNIAVKYVDAIVATKS